MRENIRVGMSSRFAETVPVNVIYDELFDPADYPLDCLGDRFVILEMDGYHLVIHESIYDGKPSQQRYKCFTILEDAYRYLEMWGIEIEKKEDEDAKR